MCKTIYLYLTECHWNTNINKYQADIGFKKNEVLVNKIMLIRNKYGVHKYTYFGNRETSIKKIL